MTSQISFLARTQQFNKLIIREFHTNRIKWSSDDILYPKGQRSASRWLPNVRQKHLSGHYSTPLTWDQSSHSVEYWISDAHPGCPPWSCADCVDLLCCWGQHVCATHTRFRISSSFAASSIFEQRSSAQVLLILSLNHEWTMWTSPLLFPIWLYNI